MKSFVPLVLLFLLALSFGGCNDRPASEPAAVAPATKEPTLAVEADEAGSEETDDRDTFDGEQFSSFIAEVKEEYQVPGMAVAVVQGDQIVMAEGFGVRNIETNEPVTPDTLFHIGSTNKSVTAMLIATLVDDGYLDWDQPVVEIYPNFALSDEAATKTVTIRHLLSMSSGFPDTAEEDFDYETEEAEAVFDLLAEIPLLGPPGTTFSYSNPSSAASGYLGVIASGWKGELYEGYATLLQERIFAPIGMDRATLSVEEAEASGHRSASHYLDDSGEVVVAESYDFTGDPLAPSGAIKANVLDMARYMSTQVNEGVAPNGERVVSAENLRETWQPQIPDDGGSHYAMGWGVDEVQGVTVITHEGSFDSFNAMLAFVPDARTGLVVLTNFDDVEDLMVVVQEEFVGMVK